MWFIVHYVSNVTAEKDKLFLTCENGQNILRKAYKQLQYDLFNEQMEGFRGNPYSVPEVVNFLIEMGIMSLRDNDFEFRKDVINHVIPMYKVHNKWWIDGIEPTNDCEGCRYDYPGQRDHMQCSTGCLHDPHTCHLCFTSP